MTAVDKNIAYQFLKRNSYLYFRELEMLENPSRDIPLQAFADASEPSAIMLAVAKSLQFMGPPRPNSMSVWLCGYEEGFWKATVLWLQDRCEWLILRCLDQRAVLSPDLTCRFEVETMPPVRSYVCTSLKNIPPITSPVTKLTVEDRAAVERYPDEYVPDSSETLLKNHFKRLVLRSKGDIFAVKEDDEILGYLACNRCYLKNTAWGLFRVHLRQESRKRGLGTQLAAAYAKDKLSLGEIPFYDYARNEASERAALKAGFVCCRTEFRAEARRR